MINDLLKHPGYDPDNLLDSLMARFKLHNDAELSRKLNIACPTISKMRKRKAPISAVTLIAMHDNTGLSLDELRALANIPKTPSSNEPITKRKTRTHQEAQQ